MYGYSGNPSGNSAGGYAGAAASWDTWMSNSAVMNKVYTTWDPCVDSFQSNFAAYSTISAANYLSSTGNFPCVNCNMQPSDPSAWSTFYTANKNLASSNPNVTDKQKTQFNNDMCDCSTSFARLFFSFFFFIFFTLFFFLFLFCFLGWCCALYKKNRKKN